MPGRINDADIEALRERANIATVIGDYTSLQRAGSRYKGLCPLHDEKTPSFTVDTSRGYFHCFGCGEGGDVYHFVMKVQHLSFPEAVEHLARQIGYDLRYEELSPGQRKAIGRRTRLVQALADAAAFYAEALAGQDGAAARAYLEQRGLDAETMAHFRLGWAPDRWDGLSRHLLAEGYTPDELVDAGLATQGRQGPMDRFRGRVLFPILDRGGRDVVAFGGRVVPGLELRTGPRDGQPPKYINSPESPVYRKSDTLYALSWARPEIVRCGVALVVEGYLDVIGLHLAGVRHAVATCGTALTAEHFRELGKLASKIVLALDADDAGFAAVDKARTLATEVGVRDLGVLPLAPGQDPFDLAATGKPAVEAALAETKTAVEFQIEHLLRTADVSTPEGQVEAYRRTFPLLARLPDRFLRFSYIRDLVAPAVRLSADLIEQHLEAEGPGEPATPPPPAAAQPDVPRQPQLRLERWVLQAALQEPELLPREWKLVTAEDFTAEVCRALHAAVTAAPPGDLDAVLAAMPDDEARARVRALAMSELPADDASGVAQNVARLRAATVQRRIDEVQQRRDRLGEQLEPAERRQLIAELLELQLQRRRLLEGGDG